MFQLSQRNLKNKKTSKSKDTEKNYNGWQFARDFSDHIFSLLNTGKIFPVILLAIIVMVGLIIWKYPDEHLPELLRLATGVLFRIGSNWINVFVIMVISNIAWLILFLMQRKIYQNEIVRLSDIRSQLMHGNNDYKKIADHRSSKGIQQEGYILPKPAKN